MKKLYLLSLLMMLSIVAMAQTVIVVDKDGNRVPYDPSKVTTVEFQTTPPGFTVNQEKGSDNYLFDKVSSLRGNPNSLFIDPGTVNAKGDGGSLAVQVKASTEFDVTTSASWITFDDEAKDGQRYVKVAMNPSLEERTGTVVFTSKDGALVSTLKVVQAGKDDARYIDIDWEKANLDSYDTETGKAQITFTADVPVMGEYDVVLLPQENSYLIRVIDSVAQTDGSKTVTLNTSEGDLTNLFKDTDFSLDFDIEESAAAARGNTAGNVFRPVKIEDFDGEKYVEVYNIDKARNLARRAQDPQLNFRFSATGTEFYKSETASMSFVKHMLQFTLKGTSSFSFGKDTSGKVSKGTTQSAGFFVEGTTYSDIEVRFKGDNGYERLFKDEKVTLKQNAIKRRFTFKVKGIPVIVFLNGDIILRYYFKTEGKVDMTAGAIAQDKIKYGATLKGSDMTVPVVVTENEKQLELVYPSLNDIGSNYLQSSIIDAYVEVYPNLSMSLFGTSATASIAPTPAIVMEAYGSKVDNSHWAINEKVEAFNYLALSAKKIPGLSKELGGERVMYNDVLIAIPERIKLLNNTPEELLVGDTKQVKFQVTHKDFTKQEYKSEGALVMLEAEGGEFTETSEEGSNQVIYKYADEEGNVSVNFKLTDAEKRMGKVKASVMQGDPNANDIPEAVWEAKANDYSITCETPNLTIKKDEKEAAAIFYLEKYDAINGNIGPWVEQEVTFTATGGTVAPKTAKSDAQGKVYVTFTPEEGATEGTIIATTVVKGNVINWEGRATANVTIESGSTIDDVELQKAEKLKENTYEVKNKKTGVTEVRDYKQQWSEWRKDQDAIWFQLEDADDDGGTKGMFYGFIPLTMRGIVLMLTGQQFENTPGAKIGFGIYEGKEVSADFAKFSGEDAFGNLNPASRILIREVPRASQARRNAPGDEEEYTGEYELLYYLVFQNQTWNQETQKMELGDEYEVYGRGTMKMHVPTITSFQVKTEEEYVKVGNSTKVVLEQYYEEGAKWDWSDVELVAQYVNYEDRNKDLGFFSWDAVTQTLTAVKSNDNKQVSLTFALKSKPSVKSYITVSVGEGWKYTSFTVGPAEQEAYPGSGCSFYINDFKPRANEDERFDNTAIEIDPASDPDDNFRYYHWNNQYSPRLDVYRTTAAPGVYNLRFRLKSDHSIGSTMKITIKKGE